ncbi:GAF domain-containing protein [Burkholderia thailandensis]|uniref:GAF domain-containing protein n=1 Tax=Burkholderia thailandensis TaxID=57975 RepID=UPI002D77BCBA|nr:GAF domain-containing protein [Burkholderia thailandensis]WRS69946.1 GAF domain-containing protein [Burkholderia thailandensis]
MEKVYLSDVSEALASSEGLDDVFEAIAKVFFREVGFRLLTITSIQAGNATVKRLWSSNHEAYPIGGIKSLGNDEWNRAVIQKKKSIVCNDPSDVRRMFADHEDIARLDCGAGVNLPVVLRGSVIGTVNIFHEPRWFSGERLTRANELLILLYAPMILAREEANPA